MKRKERGGKHLSRRAEHQALLLVAVGCNPDILIIRCLDIIKSLNTAYMAALAAICRALRSRRRTEVEVIDRVFLKWAVNSPHYGAELVPLATRHKGNRTVCRTLLLAAIVRKLGRIKIPRLA